MATVNMTASKPFIFRTPAKIENKRYATGETFDVDSAYQQGLIDGGYATTTP